MPRDSRWRADAPDGGGAHEHPRGPAAGRDRHRDRPTPVRPLAAAIARALRTLRLDSDVAKADAIRAWNSVACAVIGPDATRTTALRMDEGTLVVAVPTAQWAAEIRLREEQLVTELASRAPRSGIAKIRSVPAGRS
ncbi:MAG: DUF721 domain-containing protein [Chloroflexi bacterium]|nr:MAG: DUF721 domain-containing protein [Chloroflexota bacterium]TMF61836.1 MAG: DUF721 domain-containing protein [Chloroflexota bacterium]TMG63529.1 MAG: DUF721 domain-containing protein [Chloroflexota bacterium]